MLETFAVPNGAELFVEDGQEVQPGHVICQVGSAHDADPRRARRPDPLRGHRRGRDAPQGTRRAPAPSAG